MVDRIPAMMSSSSETAVVWFLYFCAASVAGWVLESTYKSLVERRWVNSGFLSGPFVPIYGFGVLSIALLERLLATAPTPLRWMAVVLAPSVVEYATSFLLEKVFKLRLWDYSDRPLNLNGRICLAFSACWGVLSAAIVLAEPNVLAWLARLDSRRGYFLAGALSMYFLMDTLGSSKSYLNFKSFSSELKELAARGGSFLPSLELGKAKLPREIRRLLKPLRAFPELAREFHPSLQAIPDWILSKLEKRIGGRHFHK